MLSKQNCYFYKGKMKMRDQEPDFVLIPYGWAAEVEKWPEHGKELSSTVQSAAKKIECAVVGTDLVGEISNPPWSGMVYGGQSMVSDENGQILHLGEERDSKVNVITIRLQGN